MIKWFKTGWFSSKERAELKKAEEPKVVAEEEKKPYSKIFYSNRNLTVILQSGIMLSKANASVELLNQVEAADSEDVIKLLLVDVTEPKVVKTGIETKEERDLVSQNLCVLKDHPDFVVKGQDVFLKGVNLAMPAPVIASFIELLEKYTYLQTQYNKGGEQHDTYEQIQALKMFWLKLALNPLPQSREDLLVFVRKNDIRITRNGNLILYRRIVTKTGADVKFVTFVTQQYYRLKKENQDTRNFAVARVGDDYGLVDLRDYIGLGPDPFVNLQVAYLELPTYDTNTFTSAHDNKVEIKLGGIYSIPEDKINLNNSICAAGGLHAAAVDYNYSGFGDMPVVVLVNPSKAITVPMGETGKLRTTEMFIACVNDKPLGTHFDEGALAAFDSEYHDVALSQLEEAARNKSFEALSVQDEVPAVSLVDLNTIKEMLRNRVRQVV